MSKMQEKKCFYKFVIILPCQKLLRDQEASVRSCTWM